MSSGRTAKDRQGRGIDLANYRGKVTLVTFWASWCGPCRHELPVLAQFQSVVGQDALEVIAINLEEPWSDYIRMVRANHRLKLTFLHDADGTAAQRFGVDSVPHLLIFDRDGELAHVHRGYSAEDVTGFIEEILGLLPPEIRNRPAASP